MDAFANSQVGVPWWHFFRFWGVTLRNESHNIPPQLEEDTKNCNPKTDPKCKPKLTEDEALCKYGQGGEKRLEACRRVKAAEGDVSASPQGRSLGGAYAM